MKWEEKSLDEVCLLITDGSHWSPSEIESGIPMPSVKDMDENGFDLQNTKRISRNDYEILLKNNCAPNDGDVLIAKDGSYLKHCFVFKKQEELAVLSSIAIFRSNKNIIEPNYLSYLLKSPKIKGMARNFVSGVAIPRIVLKDFKKLALPIPPLPTQRKIASNLSAYDDLIENNLRRIKLLEEKAQLHYIELIADSEKWDKVRLTEFVSVVKGKKPKNVMELSEEGSQKYLLLDTIERTKLLYTTDRTLPVSIESDVLMCMDGARSGLSFRGMFGAIGSTMAIWRSNSKRVSGEFLYQFLKQNESAIRQGNTGAAIPHANRKFILEMKLGMPTEKESENFKELTIPITNLINTLHNQNTKLREARDILLPRLMSGEIEV